MGQYKCSHISIPSYDKLNLRDWKPEKFCNIPKSLSISLAIEPRVTISVTWCNMFSLLEQEWEEGKLGFSCRSWAGSWCISGNASLRIHADSPLPWVFWFRHYYYKLCLGIFPAPTVMYRLWCWYPCCAFLLGGTLWKTYGVQWIRVAKQVDDLSSRRFSHPCVR